MPANDGQRRNLELKARDRDPAASLAACVNLAADDRGTLTQTDVYFDVPEGRLKLREEQGAGAHLIAYERPDLPGQKESRYRLVEVDDADALREALAAVLGVKVIVSKRRRLFLVEGVRIHLDHVQDLGDFIELEAVIAPGESDLEHYAELLDRLRRTLQIEEADLVGRSYSDLLLHRR